MKKFYVSTAIPYVNLAPHVGFALELVQADVLARYHRILGEATFFLTGTDEHGIKNVKTAKKQGISPQELADRNSQKFRQLCHLLNISNDEFIRTSDQEKHWPSVRKIWQGLASSKDLYLKKYNGLYCSGCELFITPKELVRGECPVHQRKPEIVEEENYFFRLSRYHRQIKEAIEKGTLKIVPEKRAKEMLKFIDQGLEDISVSRPRATLDWGIPVPGEESQIVYVWIEALSNYISALDYAGEGELFRTYWPADVHCIGKDITRFHAIYWPAILLSLGLALPKTIFVHGFITVDGQKMSKSLGNVIDPFELVARYGADSVRYFLLREIPPTEDGDFTYKKFEERYNADLAKGLGNLFSRVRALTLKAKSQKPKPKTTTQNLALNETINQTKENYKKALERFRFNDALAAVWQLVSFCDRYIDREKPWEQKEGWGEVVQDLLLGLGEIAQLLQPFLPETSAKISQQLKAVAPEEIGPLFPRLGA